jgi:predicted GTPase
MGKFFEAIIGGQLPITLALIGHTGAGKSEFQNAHLQTTAFSMGHGPELSTRSTNSGENTIDGVARTTIDTQRQTTLRAS